MTDVLPGPDLEAAIRAGVERGLDAAPVIPDLAERVRAAPSPRRFRPLLAVAASVAVVLLAVGVIVDLLTSAHDAGPDRTGRSTAAPTPTTPDDSASRLGGPPYPVTARDDDKTTAARSVGTWVPVWVAGYDGPVALSTTAAYGPFLRVQFQDGSPARSGGFHLSGRSGVCPPVRGGLLSTTGRLTSRDAIPAVGCVGPAEPLSLAFDSVLDRMTQVGVSASGVLTLYQKDTPLAQFVHQGRTRPRWSTGGTLPGGVVGAWSVFGLPTEGLDEKQAIPLGGLAFLTLGGDGRYDGSSRCTVLSGTFEVGADGKATFSAPRVSDHSCPSGPRATGSLKDVARVAHFGNFLALYDKHGRVLAELQSQLPAAIVGSWERPALRPAVRVTFGSDGRLALTGACGLADWTYSLRPSGAFSAQSHPVAQKCVGPVDPAGMVHVLQATALVTQTSRGELVLSDGTGKVLATLVRLVGG
jgi:hypothetical protein